MGIIRRTARSSLRGNKKQTRTMIIIIICACVFGIVLTVVQESFLKSKEEDRYKTYGAWMAAVYNGNDEIGRLLKNDPGIKTCGTMEIIGSVVNLKNEQVIGTMDDHLISIGKIVLEEGRLPEKNTEIAVERNVLKHLGEECETGDSVKLEISYDSRDKRITEVHTYILTGIIEPWHQKWLSGKYQLPAVLTCGNGNVEQKCERKTHYFFQYEEGYEKTEKKIASLLDEDMAYLYNSLAYTEDTTIMEDFLENGTALLFIMMLSVAAVFFALSVTFMNERYTYTVLRGIGAGRMFRTDSFDRRERR